jgi:hypothetical protein
MDNWQPIITLGGKNEGDHTTVLSSVGSVNARVDRSIHFAVKAYLVIVSALLTLGNLLLTTNF